MQTISYAMLMAVMMSPREQWTDERLDDLNKKVDDGFSRLDADIRELRGEIGKLRGEVAERFESQNRLLIGGFFVVIAAMIGNNVL